MPILNEGSTKLVKAWVHWFKEKTVRDLRGKISGEVGDQMPPEIIDVERKLAALEKVFEPGVINADLPVTLLPIFKRMIIELRKREVPQIESTQERTHHPRILQALDEKLEPINKLMSEPWLKDVEPFRIPLLTEFIPLKRIEELGTRSELLERDYDQKFKILQAPGLIIDDLHYYRERCSLRGVPVVVAFIDVDDFKKNFNEKHGEILIDRRVLPVLMSKLEAHIFCHGFAYRHGGDEFVLIIPNMEFKVTILFLDTLRRSIEGLSYPGLEQHATISTGFVYIDNDCPLTDREIVEAANRAKKFAKKFSKNRIATFKEGGFEDEDLIIVSPRISVKINEYKV